MDFSTGNSGNELKSAVVKTGPGVQQEGAYCQFLGPYIAPKVYALLPHGYVMEPLDKPKPCSFALNIIEELLEAHVWTREPLPVTTDRTWREELLSYGIKSPDDLVETPCLAHGDPTVSNFMMRPKDRFIMCDPRPPRAFVAQCRQSDRGRLLQSFYGWETVAYDWPRMKYDRLLFMDNEEENRAAHFWCGAAAARIAALESHRPHRAKSGLIVHWCHMVMELCHVERIDINTRCG